MNLDAHGQELSLHVGPLISTLEDATPGLTEQDFGPLSTWLLRECLLISAPGCSVSPQCVPESQMEQQDWPEQNTEVSVQN